MTSDSDGEVIVCSKKARLDLKLMGRPDDTHAEVRLVIECSSNYEASVLLEDLLENLRSGHHISIEGKLR